MKNIKMFGKSIPLIALVLVGMLTIGGVGAALLNYYGQVIQTPTVTQSVTITPGSHTFTDAIAGNTYCFLHEIENIAEVPAQVELATSYVPTIDALDTVTKTSYYMPVDYSHSASYTDSGYASGDSVLGSDLAVAVVDAGEWITWTYTYATSPTHTPKMTVAIDYPNGFAITTLDDGSDGWFYAPDPDVVTNRVRIADYNGENQIAGYDWVDVSAVGNVLTVSIHKSALLTEECDTSFMWHGYANYNGKQIWIETAAWQPIAEAIILEPLTGPFWVPAESTMDLLICYEFNVALETDTYTITTEVQPVL